MTPRESTASGARSTSAPTPTPRPAAGRCVARATARQRGSATLELAVITPALLILLALLIAAGRLTLAHTVLDQAAAAAARAASLARTAEAAEHAARAAALDTLNSQALHCTNLSVHADTRGFRTRVGIPAQVSIEVACTLDLSAAAVPGLPGTRTLHADAVSVLDTYRGRTP